MLHAKMHVNACHRIAQPNTTLLDYALGLTQYLMIQAFAHARALHIADVTSVYLWQSVSEIQTIERTCI